MQINCLAYVLPVFTWLFPLFPLFSIKQQQDLSHFYYPCLKRVIFCQYWNDSFFAFCYNEISLEDRYRKYWDKYLSSLSDSIDGGLLLEQANLNFFREIWLDKDNKIKWIYRSKRFVEHTSVLKRIVRWCSNIPTLDSLPSFAIDDVMVLANFSDTF